MQASYYQGEYERIFGNPLSKEFSKVVKGSNFITPQVIRYEAIKNGVVELSWGVGIWNPKVYGVTVVQNGSVSDLSQMFHDLQEAEDFIKTLK